MAKRDNSLDDSDLMRDTFKKCKDDLIQNTTFDIMYEKLNNTDVGIKRMSHIFVLRAYTKSRQSSLAISRKLYNAISKEKDEDFVHWFNAIVSALRQTGNENNGKHQELLEKISVTLQDSKKKFTMDRSCRVSWSVCS